MLCGLEEVFVIRTMQWDASYDDPLYIHRKCSSKCCYARYALFVISCYSSSNCRVLMKDNFQTIYELHPQDC